MVSTTVHPYVWWMSGTNPNHCLNQLKSAEKNDLGSRQVKQAGFICLPIKSTGTNLQYLGTQRLTTLYYPKKTASGEDPFWHWYKVSSANKEVSVAPPHCPMWWWDGTITCCDCICNHAFLKCNSKFAYLFFRSRDYNDKLVCNPVSILSSTNQDDIGLIWWTQIQLEQQEPQQ